MCSTPLTVRQANPQDNFRCRFRESAFSASDARRGARREHASACRGCVHAQDLDRLVASRAEPVRQPRVELGHLAWPHGDVVLAEDQAHLPGQDVEPLVAVMGAKVAFALGRDDDLPDREPARLLCEREDQPAVARARLESDARVADLRCADQLVERNLIRLGERKQQFEARLPLPALEPRQRALRDARRRGERRSR